MSLEEKLAAEQAALQAQRLEAQKAEQERALAPVRTRIAQIEAAKKDLAELRSQIGTDLESFLDSVKTFKGKSDQIDKLRRKFAEVLAEKGISSKGAFVEGEEFQEEQEIKEYKGAKEETKTRARKTRGVVKKIKEAVPDLTERTKSKARSRREKGSPQAWRERVVAVIDERIKELDSELAGLKLQTPEGQAERQQQYRERLNERISKQHVNFASAEGFRQLDQMRMPLTEDIAEAKVIGEDTAKRILSEAYTAKVEADFDKVKQVPERADVRRLMQYGERIRPIQAVVRDVESRRRGVLETLEQFERTDANFRDRLSRYGSSKVDRYLSHLEEMSLDSGIRWNTITETLKQAESAAKAIEAGWSTQDWFMNEYGSYGATVTTSIPDPDDLLIQANRYLEFYTRLATQLQPENFPMNEAARQALEVKGVGYNRRIKRVEVDSRLQQELIQRQFAGVRDRVVKQDREDDQRKGKIAGLIPAKVAADWTELKLHLYQRDNHATARLPGEMERQKQQVEAILRELIQIRSKLEKQADLKVQIRQNEGRSFGEQQYYVDSVDYETQRDQIAGQIHASQEELKTLERAISDIWERIHKAWRKGKLEQELAEMREREKQLQDRIKQLQNDLGQAYDKLSQPVSGLGKMLGSIKLEQSMIGQTMTVKELLDRLSRVNSTLPDLTEEQRVKLAEYNALKEAFDEANKRYEALKQAK